MGLHLLLMYFMHFSSFFSLSTWIDHLFITSALIAFIFTRLNHLKRLFLIFSSIWVTTIFEWNFSFWILSFLIFPLFLVVVVKNLVISQRRMRTHWNCLLTNINMNNSWMAIDMLFPKLKTWSDGSCQWAIAQLVLPPLIIMGCWVRLWVQDPLGVCVCNLLYHIIKRKLKKWKDRSSRCLFANL